MFGRLISKTRSEKFSPPLVFYHLDFFSLLLLTRCVRFIFVHFSFFYPFFIYPSLFPFSSTSHRDSLRFMFTFLSSSAFRLFQLSSAFLFLFQTFRLPYHFTLLLWFMYGIHAEHRVHRPTNEKRTSLTMWPEEVKLAIHSLFTGSESGLCKKQNRTQTYFH